MPSINEIIERVAAVRPDAYDDEAKAAWLIELEGKLYGEVILRHKLTPGLGYKGPVKECPVCKGFGIEMLSGLSNEARSYLWSSQGKSDKSNPWG